MLPLTCEGRDGSHKDDSYLDAVVVMTILSDVQHLHGPSPLVVASLKHNPKLVHVDEPLSWHLKNN
jgi:hypothetical protein